MKLQVLFSARDIFNEQSTHDDKTADLTVVDDDFDSSIVNDFDEAESDMVGIFRTLSNTTTYSITQMCPYNFRNTIITSQEIPITCSMLSFFLWTEEI